MKAFTLLLAMLALVAGGCGDEDDDAQTGAPAAPAAQDPAPAPSADHDDRDRAAAGGPRLARAAGDRPQVETVATGLEVPWEIAFLPDGRALIAERGGAVRMLGADGALREQPAGRIAVQATGEAGLLGIAVDPGFEDNGFVYAYRTAAGGNEVLRLRLADGRVEEDLTLVEGIESAPIHDGGRLRIGPDDHLYATTGDAGRPELAQQDGLTARSSAWRPPCTGETAVRERGCRP